jgi:hypothetical protein
MSDLALKVNGYPLTFNEVARLLGRRGGKSTSPKKVLASRENGKSGGRPRRIARLNEALLAEAGADPKKWEQILKELNLSMKQGEGKLVYGKERS